MKLIAVAGAPAVAVALTVAEFNALDDTALLAAGGDLTDPGRTAAAAAACCWLKGKIKAGAC